MAVCGHGALRHLRAAVGSPAPGYERWLATAGVPHWYGRDISSIRHGRSLEEFRVLTPVEAGRAAGELAEAGRLAGGDEAVADRVRLFRALFTLQEMAVRWAWAAFRLRDADVHSLEAAQKVVADARLVHEISRQMRGYIAGSLEQPPLSGFAFYQGYRRPTAWYEQMKSGEPGPEIRAAVGSGIQSAGGFLRTNLGPAKAAAWWRRAADSVGEPELAAACQTAARRAAGGSLKNLVSDPGFEEIGGRLAPDELAREREVVLDPGQDAHAGRHALMMEHCHRARFSRSAGARPGERFRVGLWFRRNEGQGSYKLEVDARLADRSYPVLASIPLTGPPGEWREYVAEVVAPPQAGTVALKLYVNGQSAGVRCWIDDVFIGR